VFANHVWSVPEAINELVKGASALFDGRAHEIVSCTVRARVRGRAAGSTRQAVSAGQIAGVCPAPWWGRPDLVTQALVLLERHGLVLVAAGSTRA
jgi:hypothetical protein